MTETLISLISILVGIIGANSMALIFKKYSFGIIGNTIAGVFGSIFFIKFLGKLGFNPQAIAQNGSFEIVLFIINILVSFLGGFFALIAINFLKMKLNKY
ncbi:hypothetical protein [Tenacibaculum aestuariivivum]|uniref:hypothetical protein n=1 Tax=Tenacibaculum aestuariivivum TaxID=2006131 RepID=UPI003AB8839D